MKTLLINAHPDFNNDSTYTAQMKAMFLEKYNEAFLMERLKNLTYMKVYYLVLIASNY